MQVLNEKSAILSNFEVFSLLQDHPMEKRDGQRKKKSRQNLATISYETLKYLEKTPCKYQSGYVIQEFLESLSKFELTKAEKLQLLNLRPTTPVEIQLIVEESEERLRTDQEIEELLMIVQTLPDLEAKDEVERGMELDDNPTE